VNAAAVLARAVAVEALCGARAAERDLATVFADAVLDTGFDAVALDRTALEVPTLPARAFDAVDALWPGRPEVGCGSAMHCSGIVKIASKRQTRVAVFQLKFRAIKALLRGSRSGPLLNSPIL